MGPSTALLSRISVQASSGSDYTFANGGVRLADNVSCAFRETSRQRQPPPLPIDGHDPYRYHLPHADVHIRICGPLAAKLAHVDQSLYTVREARERPVRHHPRD